jgi:5-methylcytosine-specific restriction endonuclease McrA
MDGRALLLNASFQPLQVISWQKALQLFFSGKVEIVESSDQEIRSVTMTIRMPRVIRLIKYLPPNPRKHMVRFNRNNVFLRDHHACQYCGQKPGAQRLTLDHVIPVVKGGPKSWENIVSACRPCNLRKGGRTPEEAGMRLRTTPRQPVWLPFLGIHFDLTDMPDYLRILVQTYTGDSDSG